MLLPGREEMLLFVTAGKSDGLARGGRYALRLADGGVQIRGLDRSGTRWLCHYAVDSCPQQYRVVELLFAAEKAKGVGSIVIGPP